MCLDMGEKRIGVAVSDPMHWIASPHSVYLRVGYGPDLRHMRGLLNELDADLIVVGLPRNMDGTLGASAQKAQAFADKLMEAGIPVVLWDERLSTKSAQRSLIEGGMRREQRRDTVDKVAAAVILQTYLDAQTRNQHEASHSASNAGVDNGGQHGQQGQERQA